MPSARLPVCICSCRTNMTAPPVSLMQEMLTRSLTLMGRFTIAAKHHISIAEIFESELVDIEKAIAHYEQAADYYKGEESNSSANKCLLKVGAYCAQLEQYQKAIEIYEQVGANTMDNPLLKYSAKEYFFKASLCHFIVDELNAKIAVEKYEEMFPAFSDSRECKLLKKLLEAHEEQNSEAFTEAVSPRIPYFNQFFKFTYCHVTITIWQFQLCAFTFVFARQLDFISSLIYFYFRVVATFLWICHAKSQ
uniref:N-ethylmaleimide-sensitive factor attachment protein, beta b n=1 Tax=Xiphophorus maculatus TaxID=8083 RepID=A0A3B5PP64_XIPMA